MATFATLIILGASVRAAAESAVRAGFEPYCIDLFADADTQTLGPRKKISRYPAEFLPALAAAPQAPWMYTGSLENYPRLIARLAALRPLVGNGADVVTKVRDPDWLARLLKTHEVRYPETLAAGSSPTEGRWLSKPIHSGGGMGIVAGGGGQDSGARNRINQRFVAGEAFSASFLATETGAKLLGAAGQWSGKEFGAPQPFQYAGSYAPFELTGDERHSLEHLADRLATAAGVRGLFGLDLIRSSDGLWLIEVNPRYTASMELHETIHGESFVAKHYAAIGCGLSKSPPNGLSKYLSGGGYPSTGSISCPSKAPLPLSKLLSPAVHANANDLKIGKLIVYADEGGVAGDNFEDILTVIRAKRRVLTADVPHAMSVISQASPICTLITVGESVSEVQRVLLAAAEDVRESLAPLKVPS
jgi:uncharacterized protein